NEPKDAGGTNPGHSFRRCRGGTPPSGVSLRPSGRTPPGSRINCQTSSDHLLSLVRRRLANRPDGIKPKAASAPAAALLAAASGPGAWSSEEPALGTAVPPRGPYSSESGGSSPSGSSTGSTP